MAFCRSSCLCHQILSRRLLLSVKYNVRRKLNSAIVRGSLLDLIESGSRRLTSSTILLGTSLEDKGTKFKNVSLLNEHHSDVVNQASAEDKIPFASKSLTAADLTVSTEKKDEEMNAFSSLIFLPQSLQDDDEEDVSPDEKAKYILLAFKALLWGTFFSVVGVSLLVFGIMKHYGFHSISEVLEARKKRDARLVEIQLKDKNGIDYDAQVKHFEIDLQHPEKSWSQMKEIWKIIEQESEK